MKYIRAFRTPSLMRYFALFTAVCVTVFFFGCKKTDRYFSDGFAMDSEYSVTVYSDKGTSESVFEAVDNIVSALENELSAFEASSLTARLNAGDRISAADCGDIIYLINSAEKVSELCDGRFSVFCGALSMLWKSCEKENRAPTNEEIKNAAELCTKEALDFSDDNLMFLDGGTMLDFGSVSKGFACEKAKKIFEDAGISGAVAAFGGSILVYNSKPGEDWSISIRSPFESDKNAGILKLSGTNYISTSGGYERYFEADGQRYHHIIDISTGYPSESKLESVTVICSSGVLSDALSTACFILGKEQSAELLSHFDGVSAVFIEGGGEVYTYNINGNLTLSDGFTLEGSL